MVDVILKRFEAPDEVREMIKGRFELVHLGGLTIGRATYEPGWRWSSHMGPSVGATRCTVEHVGLVLAGTATAAFGDGRVVELRAGELFHIPAEPHDSWVVGNDCPGRRSRRPWSSGVAPSRSAVCFSWPCISARTPSTWRSGGDTA